MTTQIDLDLPKAIQDKFISGEALTLEEAQAIDELVKQLDIGDTSIVIAIPSTIAPATGFALTSGTTVITQRLARIRTNVETRVHWRGLHSTVQTRAVYKVLNLSATVPTADQEKWAALLLCIAGSTGLTLFLYGLVLGPIGWLVFAAAVLASCIACFSAISPDEFKSFTGGEVTADEEKDEWG